MVGQAKVVVAGQVDDLFAVVVAHRRLLVVENAQFEMGSVGAQFIQDSGQMGKLGALSGLSHGKDPQGKRIARLAAIDLDSALSAGANWGGNLLFWGKNG
jgi:hypothetical protein